MAEGNAEFDSSKPELQRLSGPESVGEGAPVKGPTFEPGLYFRSPDFDPSKKYQVFKQVIGGRGYTFMHDPASGEVVKRIPDIGGGAYGNLEEYADDRIIDWEESPGEFDKTKRATVEQDISNQAGTFAASRASSDAAKEHLQMRADYQKAMTLLAEIEKLRKDHTLKAIEDMEDFNKLRAKITQGDVMGPGGVVVAKGRYRTYIDNLPGVTRAEALLAGLNFANLDAKGKSAAEGTVAQALVGVMVGVPPAPLSERAARSAARLASRVLIINEQAAQPTKLPSKNATEAALMGKAIGLRFRDLLGKLGETLLGSIKFG